MADQSAANAGQPALSDLIQQAMGEVSTATQAQIAAHPDLEGVINKIKSVLTPTPADVMSVNERAALPEEARPNADTSTNSDTTAHIKPDSAAKSASSGDQSFSDVIKGVGSLMTTMLLHGHQAAAQAASTKESK